MKHKKTLLKSVGIAGFLFICSQPVFAQGYGGALTYQGLNQTVLHSAAGRAMGGLSINLSQDIGMMFQNPATLLSIQGIQLSLAGQNTSSNFVQEQNYAPVRYYPNLSLLLEGLTHHIPNPDTLLPGFTAQDTVQRPYDNISPNWSRSDDKSLPVQALLAVPVSLGSVKIVAGLGAVKYADLRHYYQNNNVLSPGILSQRPLPTLRPTDDNPIEAEWLQTLRSRKGEINGYGFALAGNLETYNLSFGVSGLFLDGSSDDLEQEIARGNFTFFSNAFRLDSVYSRITKTGISEYSGSEVTLSSMVRGQFASAGVAVKLPTTITRKYTMSVSTDTTGTTAIATVTGEDELKLPWRGTIGLMLTPGEKLTVGLEYEFRPYESADYVDAEGEASSPWLSASPFRFGAEYRAAPWLALRGGMRGQAEVFEPEGSQIKGDPVTYTVYSAGIGAAFSGLYLDIAYEYSQMKYEDIWASAISKNSEQRHTIVTQLSFRLPWMP